MNKENGIKRLNRLSVQAKEYRDENTQVVKLSQAIEVIELIDQVGEPKLLSEEWLERHSEWATIQATGDYTIVVKNAWLRDMAVGETENDNKEFEALNKEYQKVSHQIDDLAVFLYQNMGIEPSGYENAVSVAIELLKKCKPEKPVVKQFVADWFEESGDLEDDLYELIGETYTSNDERTEMQEFILSVDINPIETLIKMKLYGYEVEKQKKYRIKSGSTYVWFNLDGTFRGSTKNNAVLTQERLDKLPFDVKKAVDSGIIILEEVSE